MAFVCRCAFMHSFIHYPEVIHVKSAVGKNNGMVVYGAKRFVKGREITLASTFGHNKSTSCGHWSLLKVISPIVHLSNAPK